MPGLRSPGSWGGAVVRLVPGRSCAPLCFPRPWLLLPHEGRACVFGCPTRTCSSCAHALPACILQANPQARTSRQPLPATLPPLRPVIRLVSFWKAAASGEGQGHNPGGLPPPQQCWHHVRPWGERPRRPPTEPSLRRRQIPPGQEQSGLRHEAGQVRPVHPQHTPHDHDVCLPCLT